MLSDGCHVFLKTENTLYDPIQRILAIDHADNWRVERFQPTLDQLHFIPLDSNYIDMNCNRVKRDSLAILLRTLANANQEATIFLDYDFEPLDTTDNKLLLGKDSLLYESMLSLGERLVIISDTTGNTIFTNNWKTRGTNKNTTKIPKNGGIELKIFEDEGKIRYVNLGLEKTKEDAFIEILLKLTKGKSLSQLKLPEEIEINYFIRNNRPIGRRPVLNTTQASEVVHTQANAIFAKSTQLIFIGAFHKLINKYSQTFDYFDTPIRGLNGIYINLNAYLNVATNTYIQRAPEWLIFVVNFLLAFGGSGYYHFVAAKKQVHYVKPTSWLRRELCFSLLIFVLLIGSLFYWYYMKFPFVWTLLFFVMNQSIYHFLSKKIKK